MKAAGTEVWFAPGRANLMGEHTDYNEGLVLPVRARPGGDRHRQPRETTSCSCCGPSRCPTAR